MSYLVGRTRPKKRRRPEQTALAPTDDQARLGHAFDQFTVGTPSHEIRIHSNLGNGSRWIRAKHDDND